MMENAWYSVISPENCSTILWRSWDYKEQAADVLKPTAKDMLKLKLIDGIIKEPLGGAHTNLQESAVFLKKALMSNLEILKKKSAEERIADRMDKFGSMGVYS
jgi:acetyl-CoA carboxylase carboxyl transferase subunit alpha